MGQMQASDGMGQVFNRPALALGQNSLALGQTLAAPILPLALDKVGAAQPLACMRCAKRIKASLLISCSDPKDLSIVALHHRHLEKESSGHCSIITVSLQQLMQTQSCTLLVNYIMLRSVKTNKFYSTNCQIGLSAQH